MKTTKLNPKEYISGLSTSFQACANEKDRPYMISYMKGRYDYFGVKSTPRREAVKDFIAIHGLSSPEDWKLYCKEAWEAEQRELQYFSMEYCAKYKKHWSKTDMDFFEYLITTKSWWDTVDFIASNIVGVYMQKFPEEIRPVMDRWKLSENMWLNRTALIFQLKYGKRTDFELMKEVIHLHKHSSEFFIQKAIGWALRQYAKFEPDLVRDFVANTELKPLSRREAMKHF